MLKEMIGILMTGVTLSACQMTMPEQQAAHSKATMYAATLSNPTCGSEVVLQGNTTQIKLDSNPTTGYSWRLVKPADLFTIEKDEYVPDMAQPQLVGSGGQQIFTLRAKQIGSETLSFEYARPWEKVSAAKQQVCILKVVG